MTILFQLIIVIASLYLVLTGAVILWAMAQESDETKLRKANQPWYQNWLDALD